jgi:hypothetical protein
MKKAYKLKYRVVGRLFWTTIKSVGEMSQPLMHVFHTKDDRLIHITKKSEVLIHGSRNTEEPLDPYKVSYRVRGRGWKTLTCVGDGVADGFRYFHLENDRTMLLPLEIDGLIFHANRQEAIAKRMSREAGQQVQRA